MGYFILNDFGGLSVCVSVYKFAFLGFINDRNITLFEIKYQTLNQNKRLVKKINEVIKFYEAPENDENLNGSYFPYIFQSSKSHFNQKASRSYSIVKVDLLRCQKTSMPSCF